jgi:mono/diheme cytochrome c family protein
VSHGASLFAASCAACHGEKGRGGVGPAPPLDASAHAWHHPDQQLSEWILNGKLGLGGGGMPPNRDRITADDVPAFVAYLKTLWTEEQRTTQADITRRYEEGLQRSRK